MIAIFLERAAGTRILRTLKTVRAVMATLFPFLRRGETGSIELCAGTVEVLHLSIEEVCKMGKLAKAAL